MKRRETKGITSCYDCGIPTSLLRFLGACLYGDARAFYAGLNETGGAELEAQGKQFGMTAWFYRFLYDVLPEAKRAEYQRLYQARQVRAMLEKQELRRLYRVFESHGLRFVPIKGVDLAYRLYPDAALRVFGDWDIWFHPDDCERALAVLKEDGWKVPEFFKKHPNNGKENENYHHFSPHVRGHHIMEPHFSLSKFNNINPLEIWNYTVDYPDGDGQRVLSPEMNLLMLARHASSQSFLHARIPKLLTDAAIVMRKESIDFAELRKISARWNLPYPGELLAAFQEFFPIGVVSKFKSDPVKTSKYRAIFEFRESLGKSLGMAIELNRHEARRELTGGILKHVVSLKPDKIRHIYLLPSHGAWGRVLRAYGHWIWTRSWQGITWIQRKTKIREYVRLVKEIELSETQ